MGLSFDRLWAYAHGKKFTDPQADDRYLRAVGTMCRIGLAWAVLCLAFVFINLWIALFLYALLFSVFAFPGWFSIRLMGFVK